MALTTMPVLYIDSDDHTKTNKLLHECTGYTP